ncbi:MAG: hypothetical protein FJ161_04045 [Gammaproteobacteria bacterium]|nr:hypothetical protein [Gammaproteobacteria bacterium]
MKSIDTLTLNNLQAGNLNPIHAGIMIGVGTLSVAALLFYGYPCSFKTPLESELLSKFDEGKALGLRPRDKIIYQKGMAYDAGCIAGYASITL